MANETKTTTIRVTEDDALMVRTLIRALVASGEVNEGKLNVTTAIRYALRYSVIAHLGMVDAYGDPEPGFRLRMRGILQALGLYQSSEERQMLAVIAEAEARLAAEAEREPDRPK